MGNKILGKRSRSFYKGFNQRQLSYLHQKFQTLSEKNIISKKLFMQAYKLNDFVCDKFFDEMDFTEDKKIQQYQFICISHSLCSMTIQQLGGMFFDICTKGKQKINEKNLLNFTSVCLSYNSYLQKTTLKETDIAKQNKNKFQKYDFDKNKVIDRDQFVKICSKDLDYKKWMFNMGFITERQMDFQDQIYNLVDSDMQEQIHRHETKTNQNVDKIKRGIQHRINDDEFQVIQTVGQQSAPSEKPWKKSIKGIQIKKENQSPPSQNLTIDHIYGYRSYDCRNNLKFDSKGRIVYHQGAVGIVTQINNKGNKQQSYLIQHQDDISCLDISDDLVATGQVGTKPMIILWETNKQQGSLKEQMIISKQLQNSVGNICLTKSKNLLAASCNDQNHKIIIYDLKLLRQIQKDLTSQQTGILAFGPSGKNCILDLKFTPDEKTLVAATLKEIIWITFDKGSINMNRGQYKNFSNSPTLCLISLKATYKNDVKQFIISGMGNGSVYFWQNGQCIKAVCGHSGSVSAICERKDCKSFISGDKTGKIIIWNEKFQKQKSITIPKTNCLSKMIVSLSCNRNDKQFLIGTKSSDIFTLKINDDFSKANKIMAGHSDGNLWSLVIHQTEPYFYTGGQDQRLIKWQYKTKKQIDKEVKCPYKIRSIDINDNRKILAVGYYNGIVECYGSQQLDKKSHVFNKFKNPDQQTLNLIKFDGSGTLIAVCYQLPSFKIVLLTVEERSMKVAGQISFSHKIISLDFDKNAKFIQINTSDFDYAVFDISNPKDIKKVKANSQQVRKCSWLSHSVAFSPQTKGIMTQGVSEQDIICCDRSKKFKNVIVLGDKYSKLKLFNYPTNKNQIFNKYFGHSNQITGVKFNYTEDYFISIGGQQKSIIVWKYDPDLVNNQFFIEKLLQEDQDYQQFKKKNQDKGLDQFAAQQQAGQQAMATKAFLGQIFPPDNYQNLYNPKRDNKLPQQNISIKHVFGIRTTYLKDQVRNQCKFSKSYNQFLFPTACMSVKMDIQTRQQQIFLQHKQDIVSFAIDPKRQIMATGQMAQKNDKNKLKKILSIYVWDIQNKKVLNKLDGFHTIAVILLSFSPNSKHLFTCGNDDKNTFAVYDWRSGSILYSGPISRGKVNGIAWKSDNEFLTCGNDHVKFWTNNKGRQGKIKGKTAGMFSCVNSKGIYITGDGNGGLYNWIGDQSSQKINGHSGKVQSMIVNGDYLYSGGDDGKILAWRLQKNGQIKHPQTFFDTRNSFLQMRKVIPINEEQYGVLSLDISKNGQFLIGTKGASVIHANPTRNQSKIVHQGHYKGQLWALTVRNGQQYFITGGDDCTVRLWDIKGRRQINRLYFQNKIRGLDCSNQKDCKVVVADSRAKLHLYNKNLTNKLCQQYKGKPYQQNSKQKNDPFVQDIKFSPDSQYIVYGSHLISRWMEFVKVVNGRSLQKHKQFKAGSSALLHVDWSRDSSMISINTQAYQYMFFNLNGDKVSASSLKNQQWATWTKKFGWPVQGIFQSVDYTDVNSVCRDPSGKYLAVGYDDQTIRLFRYPCYIPKQISKQFYGHSSHVTRIKFSPNHLISLGGLDRTIIVWDIQGSMKIKKVGREMGSDDQSDGLQDLDEDVDLPGKAITRKEKPKKVEQFYQVQDQGDQFMAIKPWLGAIKQPDQQYPKQDRNPPNSSISLQYVQGYRCKDCRQNLYYSSKDVLIFHAAAVLIYHNIAYNTQQIITQHSDDILSIDYHRQSNQVITGQLGPKPLVCLVKDGKVKQKFRAPVTKGVLAIAISPNGQKAVCAGMDDDHHVAVLKLDQEKPLARAKGGKKVIVKMGWVSDSQFVTIGISHFKYWTFDGKLSFKQGRNRQNLVSLAIKDGLILTGASKGKLLSWKRSQKTMQVTLMLPKQKSQNKTSSHASVIQSISIQNNFVAAGTKDGFLFILDKQSLKQLNVINMQDVFSSSNYKSENSALRSIDFLESQSSFCVGTLGAQIYTVKYRDLATDNKLVAKNLMKCHYSPNNSWTNEVWGLCVQKDLIFTCSDDATLRCWSLSQKKLLSCSSLNYSGDKIQMDKDKKTKDFQDSAKGRAVSLSPDKSQIIVGCKDGTVRVYTFNDHSYEMKFKMLFKHAKEWISDIKTAYNTLIIGSHDNAIYVYDYEDGVIKRRYKPMKKHSSYITHMDVSRDSCFLQSTCGAYQILFWDLNTGKQITSGGTMLKNQRWASWTCNLGWPVQGIYPKCTDGTFVNAVDRSHFTVNETLYQDDKKSPFLLVGGNDNGKVCLYKYPCTIKSSDFIQGNGHSSHVTNVRWSEDDKYIISTGGEDQCVMYWKVKKNLK